MTQEQIGLVQQSFTQVLAIRETAAALFYARLFAIDPSTQPLFRSDLRAQGAKLMAAIAAVVKGLSRIDTIIGDVRALAKRHVRYGVIEAPYHSVGAALLWPLEQGLGKAFTPEVRDAWAAAYELLSSAMIEAAREEMPAMGNAA